jgi:hypothetical protein
MTMDQIRNFYQDGSRVMLKPAPFFTRWLYHRFRATGLTKKLREVLGDTRLGDPGLPGLPPSPKRHPVPLKTLLLLVMYRCDTDSPWPLSNNPKAKYNGGTEAQGNNMFLPLWQLVRASTAAPTFFPPEKIVIGDQTCLFVDGAVTPYNNPSFLLYTMATLEPYKLGWKKGEDQMLIVSVGTGSIPKANQKLKADQMTMLYNAQRVPSALIYAATVEADKLCRIAGRCLFGETLDSEIGDLLAPLDKPAPSPPKDFTYVRYDPNLTEKGLTDLGLFPRVKPKDVLPLISNKHLPELEAVGKAYAQNVSLAHFGAFDPARERSP